MNRRILIIGMIGAGLLSVITIRLIHLQIFQGAVYARTAFHEHYRLVQKSSRRGSILDRRGNLVAVSLACDSLYADPVHIVDPDALSLQIGSIISQPVVTIREKLMRPNRRFCWINRAITPMQSKKLQALNARGLYFRKETQRIYPFGSLAAPVLGYANIDGQGLEGLERSQDKILAGKPGMELITHDALSRPFHSEELILHTSVPGRDITLSLDMGIQYFAQSELESVMESEEAAWGAVVVMNPSTGEIYAMASSPGYDPNRFSTSHPENRRNHCVARIIEPGSTFKPITFAAAMLSSKLTPGEPIDCGNGSITLNRTTYEDWKSFGVLPAKDVLVYSSNVGTIRIARRVGGSQLAKVAREMFGFGALPISGLPGAENGYIRTPRKWSETDTASLSIGYGIAVTPMHIATAYAILANGGNRVHPRILKTGENHNRSDMTDNSRITAIPGILREVVEKGTGKRARPKYYTAAGKTGTARRYDTTLGRYDENRVTCVFAGFAPAENPEIAVCIVIDDPQKQKWASLTAAPIFSRLTDRILMYLGTPPERMLSV